MSVGQHVMALRWKSPECHGQNLQVVPQNRIFKEATYASRSSL